MGKKGERGGRRVRGAGVEDRKTRKTGKEKNEKQG